MSCTYTDVLVNMKKNNPIFVETQLIIQISFHKSPLTVISHVFPTFFSPFSLLSPLPKTFSFLPYAFCLLCSAQPTLTSPSLPTPCSPSAPPLHSLLPWVCPSTLHRQNPTAYVSFPLSLLLGSGVWREWCFRL